MDAGAEQENRRRREDDEARWRAEVLTELRKLVRAMEVMARRQGLPKRDWE